MSAGTKWNCRRILTAGICGCNMKKPNFLEPKPKCIDEKPTHTHEKPAKSFSKIFDSHAVVKDSDDPYRDFRDSMIQMITEREIYSEEGLKQLLRCFLELNPPHHHRVIVKAFMEIWEGDGGASAGDDCGHVKAFNLEKGIRGCEERESRGERKFNA